MVAPRPSAAWRAALTCTAVSADGAWISQPTGTAVSPRALTAFSVITVFGTEVPAGSLPASWMTGFSMHIPAGQGALGEVPMYVPLTSARLPVDGSPARAVSTSAPGFSEPWPIPNVFSSAGVATNISAAEPPAVQRDDPAVLVLRRLPRLRHVDVDRHVELERRGGVQLGR